MITPESKTMGPDMSWEEGRALILFAIQELAIKLPVGMEWEDVLQCGYLGILEAAVRYQPCYGAFSHYAYIRVRGAILDGIMDYHWLTRSQLRDRQRLYRASEMLKRQLGRAATDEEISESLSVKKQVVTTWKRLADANVTYSEDLSPAELNRLEEESSIVWKGTMEYLEEKYALQQAIDKLSSKERKLVYAYYFYWQSLRDFAEEQGISRSWAGALHRRALRKLRKWLKV